MIVAYLLVDIDIKGALPTLSVETEHDGIGIIVRADGAPLGFVLTALQTPVVLKPDALTTFICAELGVTHLGAAVPESCAREQRTHQWPAITVAICTKDRPHYVQRCLQALLDLPEQMFGSPLSAELLIVDNAPSDSSTRELVDALANVRYTLEPKPGLDFARNKALQSATGDLIVFLDDDVIVDRIWLAGLMDAWSRNPDAVAFTGLVLPYKLDTSAQIVFEQRGGFRAQLSTPFQGKRFTKDTQHSPLYPCEAGVFGVGANMAFHRQTVLALGGFDEALDMGASLPGGGDLDMFYRVIRAGFPLVYEPKYLVFHDHRRELDALRRQCRGWSLGFTAFLSKSYKTDPDNRAKLRKLIAGWFKYQFIQAVASLVGNGVLPLNLVVAEIRGGLRGFLGGYSRALKRVERIRALHTSQSDDATST